MAIRGLLMQKSDHEEFLQKLNKTELLHLVLQDKAISLSRSLSKKTIIKVLLGYHMPTFSNPIDDYRALAQKAVDSIRKSIKLQLLKQCGQCTCSGLNRCPDSMAVVCYMRNRHCNT
jgi:hypothetical protein